MKTLFSRGLFLIAPLLMLCCAFPARAASLGVKDDAHFFSADAITQAEQLIQKINARHHRDVMIETVPDVPQDMQAQLQSQGKDEFFRQWSEKRATDEGVSGVYVLICKNPSHLQAAVGNKTAERLFTEADRDKLAKGMLDAFKQKHFDQGLVDGVKFVGRQMDAHVASRDNGAAAPTNSGTIPPPGPYSSSPPMPTNGPRGDMSWGFGSIACLIVAVILGIVLIRGVMGRSRGAYGQPGGYYPPGGGAYPPGAGYPPVGGYGGGYPAGGGGGFGRGFLGGLLGGALGGYATEKWSEHNQQGGGGYAPPASTGGGGADYNPGPDTSFSSSGGDFGGGGAGADFGGGGGGGGGDFGGGGGGGVDFGGGGGGDSGGGGGGGGDF